jgi:hypothetical protein
VADALTTRVQELIDTFGFKEVLLACAQYCDGEAACGIAPGLESLAREWERAAAVLRQLAREVAL